MVKIPQDLDVGEALQKMFRAQKVPFVDAKGAPLPTDTSDLDVPKVIHGRDEQNQPVTLFGCSCPGPGVATGLDMYRVDALAAITNYHGDSWETAGFRSARIEYTMLHEWMNWHPVIKHNQDVEHPSVEYKKKERHEVAICENARLAIEGYTLPGHSAKRFRLKFVHYVDFEFSEPLPAKIIQDEYAMVFLRFLCLVTGVKIFVKDIKFWNPAEQTEEARPRGPAQLLRGNPGIGAAPLPRHADNMVVSFAELSASFDSILKRWFECHERLEPVLDLYFTVLFGRAGTIDSQFLFLAQALEVYHARSTQFGSTELPSEAHKERVKSICQTVPSEHVAWLKEKLAFANQKTLAKRVQETLDLHRSEAEQLTKGIDDFATKVRYTRNYLTHYGEQTLQSGKVAEGNELMRITYALRGLLHVYLLKEMGIQGRAIDRIIHRCTSARFISLNAE